MKHIVLFIVIGILAISYTAEAEDFSIVIDAEKDTWYNQLTGPTDGLVHMPTRCYLRDVGDGNGPDDDDDLSGIVWCSYDDVYLYCYFEVTDDAVRCFTGTRYLNDNVELKMDPEPEMEAAEGNSHCRLTALGEDLAEAPTGVDDLNESNGLVTPAGQPWEPTENDYARRLTNDGYALEFRIPLNCIRVGPRALEYNETGVFGMAINIADSDEQERDNMLQWSAGHADAAHNTPSLLGSVTFMDNHILKFEAISPLDPTIVNENAEDWYSNPNPSGIANAVVKVGSYNLLTNFPNPFNPESTIIYDLTDNMFVTLKIYDVIGQEVKTLVDEKQSAGKYQIHGNASNFPSGICFFNLHAGGFSKVNKMLFLR